MSSKALEHSSRDERMGGFGGLLPKGLEGEKAWLGVGGACHLRMANLLLETRHFLALAVLVPVPANALSQVALIVFFYYYYFIL